jgi:hypothetical protein
METSQQTLQLLKNYRPYHLSGFPDTFIWPHYQGLCVGNVPATIAGIFGAQLPDALPPLSNSVITRMASGVTNVILLIVDGLGWLQLRRVMNEYTASVYHRIADIGCLMPLTSGFLSTTNSVLSTIWTGRPPIEHGLLAFEMYMREWMMAVEAISFGTPHIPFSATLAEWGFDPERFLPVPTISQVLSVQGILTYQVISKHYTRTHLSRMHYRGVREVRGHTTASDFWLLLKRTLAAHKNEKTLIGGYWSPVDTLAHAYGPLDDSIDMEIQTFGYLLEQMFFNQLSPEDREGTLLLITADHGQITTPEESAILVQDHPALYNALMMPPVGEARVPFFYVRSGLYDTVWQYLHEHFAEDFYFLSRQDVIDAGLLGYGNQYREVPYRLGDIIGIAKGSKYFLRNPELAKKLRGKHGGLTPEEMLVPLMALRLDSLE